MLSIVRDNNITTIARADGHWAGIVTESQTRAIVRFYDADFTQTGRVSFTTEAPADATDEAIVYARARLSAVAALV